MSKVREVAKLTSVTEEQKPLVDATLSFHDVKIKGKTYRLCFDLGSLAQAESELVNLGYDVNLLAALPKLNLSSVRVVFAASLRKFHPEISYEEALDILTIPYLGVVGEAIVQAWNRSLAEADEEGDANPPQPGG